MSIFGAMFSGVTGLNAQSQALGMIADNISNVNTVGYKGTTAQFFTLVTQAASRTTFTPGGVSSSPAQGIDRQGLLQASTSKTDIAIAGQGFFVVNEAALPGPGNEFLFTRAGAFDPDENGNLVNTAGYYLQGWPLTNGTTLPTNTSTLSSVQTINVANLAGTATSTANVNLALNLPSTAPAAAGGGQINTAVSTALNGITDIDYKSFGTLGQVADITYVAGTNTMTIDIGGQTGSFDLSAAVPGIYASTGTLAGIEITLNTSFDFTTDITTQANTSTETVEQGVQLGDFARATDLAGINTISLNTPPAATDDIVEVTFNSTTGVLTVNDTTAGQTGTVTIGTTGGNGVQDFTLAGGLAGGIVSIDTDTFDFSTTITSTATTMAAVVNNGAGAFAATLTTAPTFSAAALRALDGNAISFEIIDDGAGNETIQNVTAPTNYDTVTVTGGDLGGVNAVTLTFDDGAGGDSFDIVITTTAGRSGGAGAGDETVLSFTLNELTNQIASEDGDLGLTAAPTLTNFDASDLAALDQTTFDFNVDTDGRVTLTNGPTGFTLDRTATQDLATTGTRNVVVTDGTNSFTIGLDVTTAVTAGSSDIAVDLQEMLNEFGLGTAAGGGRFSATVQIFDSLGNAHDLVLEFDKVATNSWQILVNDPVLATTGVTSGTVASSSRSINFNGDGTPSAITFPAIAISGWTTGANDNSVAINVGSTGQAGGVTQFAGEFSLSSIDQDGVRFGGFVGVNIDENGTVTAVFDNGEQLPIYKLALTRFANPNGLEAVTGNAFRQTDRSGDILLQQANTGGAGSVASSALESSTVDLAEEFTRMITTQRAYSASARIITTADEMLEELIRIRR
jgi:flagellar hook protein FlgE